MKKLYYRFSDNLIFLFVVFMGVMLIMLRDSVADGIKNALTLTGEVLIPSLLPFMILSSFAVEISADRVLSPVTEPFMRRVFRLPGKSFAVLLFGFVGGYPVGMSLATKLYEKGMLNESDVRHISSFCVNAGPAFTVMIAGGAVAGSRKAGFVMLISTVISSLLTGIAYSFFKKRPVKEAVSVTEKADFSTALVNAVRGSQGSILSVCSWVMAFSVVLSVAECYITDENIYLLFSAFAEVTNGVRSAMKAAGVCGMAAAISFGGLSVMCQLMPMIKKCGIKAKFYLTFRIVNSLLSYCITKLILCFVTVDVQVFSQDIALSGNNAPASAALLIMGAVFIYDLQKNGQYQSSFSSR